VPHFRLLACDFCGAAQGLRSYPTERLGQVYQVCAVCVGLINNEDWDNLIERIITAFTTLEHIPESEESEFRRELAKAFHFSIRPLQKCPSSRPKAQQRRTTARH
jgi:hypothetical protein